MTTLIEPRADGVALAVRVICRAQPAGIAGERDGRLLIRVAAAPVEGAANTAVVEAVARWLGVARSAVTIAAGERSRNKRLRVVGVRPTDVRAALERL